MSEPVNVGKEPPPTPHPAAVEERYFGDELYARFDADGVACEVGPAFIVPRPPEGYRVRLNKYGVFGGFEKVKPHS